MTLEELLENFKKQQAELSKTIKEGTEQLEILKERLIRVSGAVEGIQLAIENVDKPSPEEKNERGETEILSK